MLLQPLDPESPKGQPPSTTIASSITPLMLYGGLCIEALVGVILAVWQMSYHHCCVISRSALSTPQVFLTFPILLPVDEVAFTKAMAIKEWPLWRLQGRMPTCIRWQVQQLTSCCIFCHCMSLLLQIRQDEVPLFVGGDSSGGGTTMSLVLTLSKRPMPHTPGFESFFVETSWMCFCPDCLADRTCWTRSWLVPFSSALGPTWCATRLSAFLEWGGRVTWFVRMQFCQMYHQWGIKASCVSHFADSSCYCSELWRFTFRRFRVHCHGLPTRLWRFASNWVFVMPSTSVTLCVSFCSP